jgi:hypothetical protein
MYFDTVELSFCVFVRLKMSSSTACLTIQQAVDAVNSLTAAQLLGCDNVTISLGRRHVPRRRQDQCKPQK